MRISKKGLSRVLNEDNTIIGDYTNFSVEGNVAIIEITKDGLKKTKEMNIHQLTSMYKDFLFQGGLLLHVWQTPKGWVTDIHAKFRRRLTNDWFEPTIDSEGMNDYSMYSNEMQKIKLIVNGREIERSANHKKYHETEFEAVSMIMDWFLKNEGEVVSLKESLEIERKKEEVLIEPSEMIGSN